MKFKYAYYINLTKLVCIFIMATIYMFPAYSSTDDKTIKIAVIEDLMSQKYSSEEYAKNYLKGIELSKEYAKKKHINIVYKGFFYDQTSLSIVQAANAAIQWNPDFIIGPRSSDNFLLLQYVIPNSLLVLSPLASALSVKDLPNNFYSLAMSDSFEAKAILAFLNAKYTKQGLFIITEADCKSCSDISDSLINQYSIQNNKSLIVKNTYISDEASTIEIRKLMNGYQPGDVIVIPSSSYSAGILIPRIINYLKQPNLIFIGGDSWGTWVVDHVSKVQADFPFRAYRVINSTDDKNNNYAQFYKYYVKKYGDNNYPDDITFLSYNTVTSVLNLIGEYPINSDRKEILDLYENQVKHDDFYFKNKNYVVYKVEKNGEKIVYQYQI